MQRARALHTTRGVHPAVGLALMLAGAIAIGRGFVLDRRRRRALARPVHVPLAPREPIPPPPRVSPMATPLHEPWRRPVAALPVPMQPVEVYVKHPLPSDEEATDRAEPRVERTSPWSTTAVDDAQLDPTCGGLALAPGRHTIVVVCSDCAKARTIKKTVAARASLAAIVGEQDEAPITSAALATIEPEPLRSAHGGLSTSTSKVPRHAADPWDFAHHDRRRR